MKKVLETAYFIFQITQQNEICYLEGIREKFFQLEEIEAACEFLTRLSYIVRYNDGKNIRSESSSVETNANRMALLKIASLFDNAFELPMEQTPAAFFLGAMVSPKNFGNSTISMPTIGTGGCSESFQKAFESCCGEAAEYLSFIQQKNCSTGLSSFDKCGLTKRELNWVSMGLGGKDGASFSTDEWIAANSLQDGRRVYFPYEFVVRKPVDQQVSARLPESTGIGAGITLQDAIHSGILEVIERDAIALWWFGGNSARPINDKRLKETGILDCISRIRSDNSRQCWFLDITTNVKIPTVVALSSLADGSSVVAGFGSHPIQERALKRALLELCQMEMAQEISLVKAELSLVDKMTAQDSIWVQRHKELNIKNFPQLIGKKNEGDHRAICNVAPNKLHASLQAIGLEAYYVDLSQKHINIPVVKVLIPGLQSSKVDWISERLITTAMRNQVDLNRTKYFIAPI